MKMSPGDTVLVTGGTGVITAWAVRELVESGFRPVVVTRGITTVGQPILRGFEDRIEFVTCDLERPWALVEAVKRTNPAGIVHMASSKPWQIDPPYVSNPDPVTGIQNMINGTTNILEAARHFGIKRVVYGSSKGAYSPTLGEYGHPAYKPIPESYETNPTRMYGIGKRSAEMIGIYYNEVFGVDFVAVRLGSTFGPFKRGASGMPAALIAQCAAGEPIDVEVDEFKLREERHDYVYNRDIGRGILQCCTAENPTQRIYNLGSGTATSLEELFAAMKEAIPATRINVKVGENALEEGGRGHQRDGVLDISAARRDLGYEPQYDLVTAIRDMASVIGQGRGQG